MKRIISILTISMLFGFSYSQSDDDKNYRLSFLTECDYSFNKYQIEGRYVFLPDPSNVSADIIMTVTGKPAFGEGMRLELFFENKLSYAISGMMIDKGYSINQDGSITNYFNIDKVNSFSRVYLSFPVEMIYRFNRGINPVFFKSGFSIDLNFSGYSNYRLIASSFIFGVGKSFKVNEILLISVEPTFRYSLFNYADQVQIIPDRFDHYRPISIGFMICLSQ